MGSCSLARRKYSIKQSVLFYSLRQFKQSRRQEGPGRHKGEDRGTPVGVSRGTGGEHVGPTPAGFPRTLPAVMLGKLGRAVAILQSVLGKLPAIHRERTLSGPLITLLELLAEESQGLAPTGVDGPCSIVARRLVSSLCSFVAL